MAKIGNDKFNETVYNYVSGSSLYAYLSHYFFILIISVMIIRPYKINFIPALFIMLFGTNLLIFITYVPLNFLWELISPPKKTKAMDLTPVGMQKKEEEPIEEEAAMAQARIAAQKAAALEGKSGGAIDLEGDMSGLSGASEIKEGEGDDEKFE